MGEDRSIPDHVNDNVPVDEVARAERYCAALEALEKLHGVTPNPDQALKDAATMMTGIGRLGDMKRIAFINAAVNNVPQIIAKLRASYPGIVDLQGLVDRVRLEAIMRRLDGL